MVLRTSVAAAAVLTWVFGCSAEDAPYDPGASSLSPPVDQKHNEQPSGDPTFLSDVDASTPAEQPPPNPLFQPDFGALVTQTEPPPPIFGGTLTMAAGGNLAIAADPDRNQIYLVDLVASSVRTISTGAGSLPFRVAEDGSRRAHVTLRGTGELLTIDLISGSIIARRAVCAEPRGVAYEAASDRVHVACDGGALVSLPSAGGDAVRTVQVGAGLRDIVVVSDGLLVSKFRQATVSHVGQDGAVTGEVGPPLLKGAQNEVAWRMIANPAGGVTMLHQRANTQPINIQQQQQSPYGGCGGSAALDSTLTVFGGAPSKKPALALTQMVVPVDVAYAPDGVTALVVSPANSRTKALVSFGFFGPKEQPPQPCGNLNGWGPVPNDPLPSSQQTYQFVAAAFDALGHAVLQSREPAALVLFDGKIPHKQVRVISLSDVSRVDTGHMVFHANSGAMLACASCHPEGGDDGHVWLFSDTNVISRRTPSLRGTVLGTAPYHWDGAFKDLGALVEDVFTRRMGGPSLGDIQKGAIRSWVESIPAPKQDAPSDWAAVSRGAQLFTGEAKCSSCHSGVHRTNNMTLNVGTGGPLQTPSLVGVAARAPYLHDGCANTLDERFGIGPNKQGMPKCGGGDAHGHISQLRPDQIDDLVAYLNTL